MSFTESISVCFRKYATFSGRASRTEFWWFWLLLVGVQVFGVFVTQSVETFAPLFQLFWWATLIPLLAVTWRRMHDAGFTGALILAPFAVQVASIYVAMFAMMAPLMQAMSSVEVTEDTTFGEWERMTSGAMSGIDLSTWTSGYTVAACVFAAGALWAVYLLTRPSELSPNSYGPNPHEVMQ